MQIRLFGDGKKRGLRISIFITVILILICPVLIILAETAAGNPATGGNPPAGTNPPPANGTAIVYKSLPVASDDVYTKGSLLIVNTTTPVVHYPADSTLVAFGKPTSYSTTSPQMRLNSEAMTAFNTMLNTYHASTGDSSVHINSAYRTEAEQAAMTSSSVKAGFSDHHLALSVALRGNTASGYIALAKDHWVYQNCHTYGFVLRYPAGKEEITGISDYENCIRYVGVPHAIYMKEHNLCLEEYVALLKNYPYEGTHLQITANGALYEVYYIPASDLGTENAVTTLPIPHDSATDKPCEYTYSGNNTDGFIVTARIG